MLPMSNINSLTTTQTNLEMCRALKLATLPGLKKKVSVGRNPVIVTEHSLIFEYYYDGHAKHYELDIEDAGEVLCEAGVITRYEGMRLYKKRIATTVGKDGTPLMWAVESEVEPCDLKLTTDDVIHIVANWEYEIIGTLMGLIPYKPKAIRRSINSLQRAM